MFCIVAHHVVPHGSEFRLRAGSIRFGFIECGLSACAEGFDLQILRDPVQMLARLVHSA